MLLWSSASFAVMLEGVEPDVEPAHANEGLR